MPPKSLPTAAADCCRPSGSIWQQQLQQQQQQLHIAGLAPGGASNPQAVPFTNKVQTMLTSAAVAGCCSSSTLLQTPAVAVGSRLLLPLLQQQAAAGPSCSSRQQAAAVLCYCSGENGEGGVACSLNCCCAAEGRHFCLQKEGR